MLVFTIAELILLLVSAVAGLAFSGVQIKALWRAAAVFTLPALGGLRLTAKRHRRWCGWFYSSNTLRDYLKYAPSL